MEFVHDLSDTHVIDYIPLDEIEEVPAVCFAGLVHARTSPG